MEIKVFLSKLLLLFILVFYFHPAHSQNSYTVYIHQPDSLSAAPECLPDLTVNQQGKAALTIIPNPFSEKTIISFPNTHNENFEFSVFDILPMEDITGGTI
jgi:hypothetical protein